jgi:D-sedoheptulose 7-phosphate isomerase
MVHEFARAYFRALESCYREVSLDKIDCVAGILLDAQEGGRQVFILGNGGSSATASHMACDLSKTAIVPGQRGIRAMSLADNVPVMTAWANDVSYADSFREQLVNFMDRGDVVIGISASGNSPNVLRAIEYANEHGAITVGLIGFGGGKLKDLVHVDITISSRDYGQVEDFHVTLDHILAQYVRQQLTLKNGSEGKASSAGTN